MGFMEYFVILVIGSLSFLFYVFHAQLTYKPEFPPNVPWVGKDSSKFFAESRAMISSFNNARRWLAEGYEKASPQ